MRVFSVGSASLKTYPFPKIYRNATLRIAMVKVRMSTPRCPKCLVPMRYVETLPPVNDLPALYIFQCESCELRDSVPMFEEV